ncbi:Trifunctional nucleotide phosphoesterase protein YfkN [Pseudidiomarina piscicola]|uniref:Trifunctional nucleotide phosphoesterase protein YfkN n=1 Tax=Pseudidiomarina piscicola TaxID=2614830 RepID=A0A6Z0BX06_9GAMM|nr:bifunctional 2',3'-cyclic-nucleotide 2'-phosphodiesterase/3'-nucleotidase [Pseudidiomarina piscicola]CAB0149967.1 Trifunctional nucleotide phosphoesterase protein YfkN [Pseudidiomarina piscicola]VZT39413.1 Trifunctional nucleotide phosphoesterase protein YfkN [Pseudomonas aeruginosa]
MPSTNKNFSTTLRIMETSDVHGQVRSFDYFSQQSQAGFGLAATANAIEQARQQQPLNLLIENGDLIQGSALADWAVAEYPVAEQTHPILKVLNALNYDVANLGNHEFNFGLEFLADTYRDAQFPVISSNLQLLEAAPEKLKQRLVSQAWIDLAVTDTQGTELPLKVAVVGVLPPQIMQWDQHHLANKVEVLPMLSSAQHAVRRVREQGADVVILAAHTGMPKQTSDPDDNEQAGWLLAGIDGVDALLLGHQHEVFPGTEVYNALSDVDSSKGTIRGTPAVQPGLYGSHLGLIDLTLSYNYSQASWQVIDAQSESRAVSKTIPANAHIEELVNEAHQATLTFMQQPIGTTSRTLSYRTARWQPSSAVQFVQRAQVWQAQQLLSATELPELPILSAAAPFDAAYTDADQATTIAAGPLTRGAIGDLYRYPNTLDIVKLNGAQLHAWLERSAEGVHAATAPAIAEGGPSCWSLINPEFPHYNFDSILGLSYQIDPQQAVGERVSEIRYDGKPLQAEQEFYVATNNYRANGGGDFPHLDGSTTVVRGADMLSDVLLKYIDSLPEQNFVEETDRHWQLVGCEANKKA